MKMLSLFLMLIFALPVFSQELTCGPKDAKFRADTDEVNHPVPDAKPDMALLYVLRQGKEHGRVMATLAVDGEWLGANRGDNYFVIFVTPGKHSLCSRSRAGKRELLAEFAAGKTYYLEQRLNRGGLFAPVQEEVIFLDETKGKPIVAAFRLSVMSKK